MGKVAMTLYEIDEAIYDCFDDETGDLDQEKFDQLQGLRKEKLEGIALGYKNLVAEAEKIRNEEKVLSARRKVLENKANSMKNFLAIVLNGEKLNTPRVAVSWRASKNLVIYDEPGVPEEFLKYSDPAIDKKALTDAIKAGKSFPGVAALVENTNIQIK